MATSKPRATTTRTLKGEVSRYMSYLLRHDPENLDMDRHGFVGLDELLDKIGERFHVDRKFVLEIVEKSKRRRYETVGGKIRALYGHTIPVELELIENLDVKILHHGTTSYAASRILKVGLKPMKRRWVHLSPTIEAAVQVGLRRTSKPIVLMINADKARKDGVKFHKATDTVYLSSYIRPECVKHVFVARKILISGN